MSIIPKLLDAAQSMYLVTPSTCNDDVSTRSEVSSAPSDKLTTQALLASTWLFRGSGCARSSGLLLLTFRMQNVPIFAGTHGSCMMTRTCLAISISWVTNT